MDKTKGATSPPGKPKDARKQIGLRTQFSRWPPPLKIDEAAHAGVPRDADGVPIFLILPPGVRESYERKMAHCEAGWRATGDPAFFAEASILMYLHRQPQPLWFAEAACTLAWKRRAEGKRFAKRVLDAHVHFLRYEMLRDAKEDGLRWLQDWIKDATEKGDAARAEVLKRDAEKIAGRGRVTWPEAEALAAAALSGTLAAAEGDTIRKDHDRVKADIKAGRGARYFPPKLPYMTLTQALQKRD
jgi:hypothetical protein